MYTIVDCRHHLSHRDVHRPYSPSTTSLATASAHDPLGNFDNGFLELPLTPNSRRICRSCSRPGGTLFWVTWSSMISELSVRISLCIR